MEITELCMHMFRMMLLSNFYEIHICVCAFSTTVAEALAVSRANCEVILVFASFINSGETQVHSAVTLHVLCQSESHL